MMISIALALLLSQTAPTQAQVIGALNILEDGVVAVHNGSPNVTIARNASNTRACITRVGGVPTGTTTVRFGVIIISPRIQYELGMAIPADVPTNDGQGHTYTVAERWALAGERYAAMEIQAVPTSTVTFDVARMNEHLDVIREEVEVRASPLLAACEIAIARRDAPEIASNALYRCACAQTPATCTYDADGTGPGIGVTPAPTGFTFPPGTWSGAGCKPKPCFTRFDGPGIDASWPAECPK